MPTCAAPSATPNTANCNRVVGNLTEVGAYTGSASPSGTFDQGGNVSEWLEDVVITIGPFRALRGGAWYNRADTTQIASDRNFANPRSHDDGFGFRLVMVTPVPEPGTLGLCLVGLVGLAARRR